MDFAARLVWKQFVGLDDCLAEYDRWRATVADQGPDN